MLEVVLNNFERITNYKQSRMPSAGNTKYLTRSWINRENIPIKFPEYSCTYLETYKNKFKLLLMRNGKVKEVDFLDVQTFALWRGAVIVFLSRWHKVNSIKLIFCLSVN